MGAGEGALRGRARGPVIAMWPVVSPLRPLVVVLAQPGTGGCIAGVSQYLKERSPDTKVYLADPQGSCLYNRVRAHPNANSRDWGCCLLFLSSVQHADALNPGGHCVQVMYGIAYAPEQAEKRLKRHRYDTIIEGIGIDRLTANFLYACFVQ